MLLTAACSKDTNFIKVSQEVRKFNTRFNAEKFHEIYADAAPELRASISEESFVSKLENLRRQHGMIRESSMNGFEEMSRWQRYFPNTKSYRFIGLYNKCETGGFQEFFTWDVRGGEPKLLKFETEINASAAAAQTNQ